MRRDLDGVLFSLSYSALPEPRPALARRADRALNKVHRDGGQGLRAAGDASGCGRDRVIAGHGTSCPEDVPLPASWYHTSHA
jgi:hypothetical protein